MVAEGKNMECFVKTLKFIIATARIKIIPETTLKQNNVTTTLFNDIVHDIFPMLKIMTVTAVWTNNVFNLFQYR